MSNRGFDLILDPDSLYNSRSESITFIYDPVKDKLYAKEFPNSHYDIHSSEPDFKRFKLRYSEVMRNKQLIEDGLILGRIGVIKKDPQDDYQDDEDHDNLDWLHAEEPEPYKAIVFWNTDFKNNTLTDCLEAVVRKFPLYNDPETLVVSDHKHTYDRRKGFRETLLGKLIHVDQPAQKYTAQQHRPECSVTLDVKGIPTDLSTILGNFHMVKDDRLPAMKAAVCSQGPALRQRLQKSGCTAELAMLEELLKKAQCNKGGEYDSLKQGGRISRRQELQKIFADPELTSRNFRTQKELDAAWDELQGKKEHRMYGFKTFVQKFL